MKKFKKLCQTTQLVSLLTLILSFKAHSQYVSVTGGDLLINGNTNSNRQYTLCYKENVDISAHFDVTLAPGYGGFMYHFAVENIMFYKGNTQIQSALPLPVTEVYYYKENNQLLYEALVDITFPNVDPSLVQGEPISIALTVQYSTDAAGDNGYFATGKTSTSNITVEGFIDEAGTILPETGSNWRFTSSDYNKDGYDDIVAIKQSSTGTNSTEVHILNGSNNFASYLLEVGTPLSVTDETWDFDMADYNNDGYDDLYCILKDFSGSGKMEAHILDGANNFQSWLQQTTTTLNSASNYLDWSFIVGDYNQDNNPDLYGVLKNSTGSGSTEVHILNGANNFQSAIIDIVTPIGCFPDANTKFLLNTNKPSNCQPDLVWVFKNNTGTASTEIHVLSGSSSYQSFIKELGTIIPETDDTWDFVLADHNLDNYQDFVGIKKQNTGTLSTEVHILNGNCYFSNCGNSTLLRVSADSVQQNTGANNVQNNSLNNTKVLNTATVTAILAPFSPNSQSINIYPNPFTDKLEITNLNGASEISIFDINGQLMKQEAISTSSDKITINTSELNPGMYYYSIKNGTSITSRGKLVKN